MTGGATPPSCQIAPHHGPYLPQTHPNRAIGLVLGYPSAHFMECRLTRGNCCGHFTICPGNPISIRIRLQITVPKPWQGSQSPTPPCPTAQFNALGSRTVGHSTHSMGCRARIGRFPHSLSSHATPGKQLPAPQIHGVESVVRPGRRLRIVDQRLHHTRQTVTSHR